jgi:hypothetical protein
LRKSNPDRASPPVAQLGLAGVVLAGITRALIDRYVDPADRELWWNLFQTIVVPGVALLFAWIGAKRAKRNVTPILTDKGDVPRDLDGNDLAPASHNPSTGYPPTRAARPEERPRRKPPFDA